MVTCAQKKVETIFMKNRLMMRMAIGHRHVHKIKVQAIFMKNRLMMRMAIGHRHVHKKKVQAISMKNRLRMKMTRIVQKGHMCAIKRFKRYS